jgi:hypothetical protein
MSGTPMYTPDVYNGQETAWYISCQPYSVDTLTCVLDFTLPLELMFCLR